MTSTSEQQQNGIRDWVAKRRLLVLMFDASNHVALLVKWVQAYNKSIPPISSLDEEKVLQAAQKWHHSTPDKYYQFWEWIVKKELGLTSVTPHRLWSSSFVNFIEVLRRELPMGWVDAIMLQKILDAPKNKLGEDQCAALRRMIEPELNVCDSRSSQCWPMETPLDEQFEGVLTGIKAGQLCSWHCFLTPEAARSWNSLVENGNYAMYSVCLRSLGDLLQTSAWKNAVTNQTYNVGVALAGGGSPEKDVLLAHALATATQQNVQYWMVDVSHDMMHESQGRIHRSLEKMQLANRIALRSRRADILRLHRWFHRPYDWNAAVWAILGGTIGNLPEREFFDSIASPTVAGDLLVVGLDTHDGEQWDEFQERIRSQYQGEEVYDTNPVKNSCALGAC
ncbi:MAG: hypothetical protein GC164_06295 [Phycisphaera sp.]|nr:hypothetical protein [Phycisphaera sp.]